VTPWRARECIASLSTRFPTKFATKELGDAYLEKCNRYRLTRNLVRPFERLGSSVTLQQKAA